MVVGAVVVVVVVGARVEVIGAPTSLEAHAVKSKAAALSAASGARNRNIVTTLHEGTSLREHQATNSEVLPVHGSRLARDLQDRRHHRSCLEPDSYLHCQSERPALKPTRVSPAQLTQEAAMTQPQSSTEYIRSLDANDPNNVDKILQASNTDQEASIAVVKNNADTIFTWDYEKGARPRLNKLYEKAKGAMWDGEVDLDWSTDVDIDKVVADIQIVGEIQNRPLMRLAETPGGPFKNWSDKEFHQLGIESFTWQLSQFMHGEQGALIATAKIVETVPWIDAKYYASTQVMDEARHVEVFAKYLDTKIQDHYPINPHLQHLLDDVINDSRWDMTYLGMQIMIEGLALAAFGFLHGMTNEPLLKKLLRYVMSDEARHVAFGVLSLQEVYENMSLAEIQERQEFAFEAALRMRDRFLRQEVWHRMGVDDLRPIIEAELNASPEEKEFQRLLFSKIVPNCKKLGLLDAGEGWLRTKFQEIGVIEFEHMESTDTEYAEFALGEDAAAS